MFDLFWVGLFCSRDITQIGQILNHNHLLINCQFLHSQGQLHLRTEAMFPADGIDLRTFLLQAKNSHSTTFVLKNTDFG